MDNEKKQKQQDTDQFNENKDRNKKEKLKETIQPFITNKHLCYDDHLAILKNYHDEKTDPKISNLTAPVAKAYFDDWGHVRLVADLVVMNATPAPAAIEAAVMPNLANTEGFVGV
jgi:hypothetical protein